MTNTIAEKHTRFLPLSADEIDGALPIQPKICRIGSTALAGYGKRLLYTRSYDRKAKRLVHADATAECTFRSFVNCSRHCCK
jgi:hypothetical protein